MEKEVKTVYAEGTPWFWKIFGGAVLGVISFLLLAHINNINTSIYAAKNEQSALIKDLQAEIKSNRTIIVHRLSMGTKTVEIPGYISSSVRL